MLPLPISALRVPLVALKNPGNIDAAVSLTKGQYRYGFGNGISEDESDELFDKWPIPSPGRPLFQAASANCNPHAQTKGDTKNEDRGPYKQYRHSEATTELTEFADRSHSPTIDQGWREIADSVLLWLKAKGI